MKKKKLNSKKNKYKKMSIPKSQNLPGYKLEGTPTIIISKEMTTQIAHLHKSFPAVEWSGPLLYKIQSGNLNNLNDLVIKCDYVHPMDIGSATFTEVTQDPDLFFDMEDQFNIAGNGYKLGYCHTHHNMEAFFSGTDQDELYTNAVNYPYYLSLIVNHKCSPVAKIAIKAKRVKKVLDDSLSYKTEHEGNTITHSFATENSEQDVICEIECKVIFETDEWFITYLEKLKEKNKKPVYAHHYHNNDYTDNYIGKVHDYNNTWSANFVQEFILKHISAKPNYTFKPADNFVNEYIRLTNTVEKELKDPNNKIIMFKLFRDSFLDDLRAHFKDWHKTVPNKETQKAMLRDINKWVLIYQGGCPSLKLINESVYKVILDELEDNHQVKLHLS
jgi:hypothetical protein